MDKNKKKKKKVEDKSREDTHGRLVSETDTDDYLGSDYDEIGWIPKETKKADNCARIYDFRMVHLRRTRYPAEKGGTEYREVMICCWCHRSWFPNVTKMTNHLVGIAEDVAPCEAKIPRAALAEYERFHGKEKMPATPRKPSAGKKRKAASAFDDDDKGKNTENTDLTLEADEDETATAPSASEQKDKDAALDHAITMTSMLHGVERFIDVIGAPLFRDVLKAVRKSSNDYRPPTLAETKNVHIPSLYQKLLDTTHTDWGDRPQTCGITLLVDALQGTKPPLVLVSASCPNRRTQALDVINCEQHLKEGDIDASLLVPFLDRHISAMKDVNLVVIEGGRNFDRAQEYLQKRWPNLFVLRGAVGPAKEFVRQVLSAPEARLILHLCSFAYTKLLHHDPVRKEFLVHTAHLDLSGRGSSIVLDPEPTLAAKLFSMHRLVLSQSAVRATMSSETYREHEMDETGPKPEEKCLTSDSFYEALLVLVRVLHPTTLLLKNISTGDPQLDHLHFYARLMTKSVTASQSLLNEAPFFREDWPKNFCATLREESPLRRHGEAHVAESGPSVSSNHLPQSGSSPRESSPTDSMSVCLRQESHTEAKTANGGQPDNKSLDDAGSVSGTSLGEIVASAWATCRSQLESHLGIAAWMLSPSSGVHKDKISGPWEPNERQAVLHIRKRIFPRILESNPVENNVDLNLVFDQEYANFSENHRYSAMPPNSLADLTEWHSANTVKKTQLLGRVARFLAGKPCGIGEPLQHWTNITKLHLKDTEEPRWTCSADSTDKASAIYATYLLMHEPLREDIASRNWRTDVDGDAFDTAVPEADEAPSRRPPIKRFVPAYDDIPARRRSNDEVAKQFAKRFVGLQLHVRPARGTPSLLVSITGVAWNKETSTLQVTCAKVPRGSDSTNSADNVGEEPKRNTLSLSLHGIFLSLLDSELKNKEVLRRQGIGFFSLNDYQRRWNMVEKHLENVNEPASATVPDEEEEESAKSEGEHKDDDDRNDEDEEVQEDKEMIGLEDDDESSSDDEEENSGSDDEDDDDDGSASAHRVAVRPDAETAKAGNLSRKNSRDTQDDESSNTPNEESGSNDESGHDEDEEGERSGDTRDRSSIDEDDANYRENLLQIYRSRRRPATSSEQSSSAAGDDSDFQESDIDSDDHRDSDSLSSAE